ncbi:MAG: hypothetical protein QW251_05780 [Desulfurococcaceae archaeon]
MLDYTLYYGAYKFAIFHIPLLGLLLRNSQNVRPNPNLEIAGQQINVNRNQLNYGLRLNNVNFNTVFYGRNNLFDLPLITMNNFVIIPIYTMQGVDIVEANNDIQDISAGNVSYPLYNITNTYSDLQITYLELMSMPVSRFHYIWLKYLNNSLNNEYYVAVPNQENIFNYIPPFANLYIFNFSPDLKHLLNAYKFIKVMPVGDVSVRALSGNINDVDVVEITVTYKYETLRRLIRTDTELQYMQPLINELLRIITVNDNFVETMLSRNVARSNNQNR